MKFNFVTGVLVTALALTAAVPLTGIAQEEDAGMEEPGSSADEPTVFACGEANGKPATIAQKGEYQSPPLIVWRTTYFGEEFTPEERCRIVSEKLTQAVADNGGSLANLNLTHGTVNRQTVICYVEGQGRCNADNMLFTLKPANARNAPGVIQNIRTFATGTANTPPLVEAGSTRQEYANLQSMLSRSLRLESAPSRPTRPSSNPGQTRPNRRPGPVL